MTAVAELVVDARNAVGESPVWHGDEQALYWVDIPARALCRWNAATAGALYRLDAAGLTQFLTGLITPNGEIPPGAVNAALATRLALRLAA